MSPSPPTPVPSPASKKRSADEHSAEVAAKRQHVPPLVVLAAAAVGANLGMTGKSPAIMAKFRTYRYSGVVELALRAVSPSFGGPDAAIAPFALYLSLQVGKTDQAKTILAHYPPSAARFVYRLFCYIRCAHLDEQLFGDDQSAVVASVVCTFVAEAERMVAPDFPPASRLVCVETNPGPPKGKSKVAVVVTKKKKGTPAKVTIVKGRGDYKPTVFARTRGRGDYVTDAVSSLGGAAGRFLGDKVGGAISSFASPFLKLIGMGDYRAEGPKHNSLYQRDEKSPISAHHQLSSLVGGNPNPMNMGACSVQFGAAAPRVTHREYVGPIYGGTGFVTRLFRIQPGLVGPLSMFPWGASIAKSFQQYRLRGMILEYKSTSTNYAAGTALGTVMMSTLYDADSAPLASVAEIDNNDFTTSDAPCNSFIHPIECASDKNTVDVRYVRTSNASSSSSDNRLSDVGLFQISTNGLSATSTTQIGELWCSYDIEFLKPALIDQHVGTTFQATGSSSAAVTHNAFALPVLDPENSLPVTLTSSTIIMPAGYNGNYMVVYSCTPASGAATVSAFSISSAGSDITGLPLFQSSTGTGTVPGNNTGLGQVTMTHTYPFSTVANNSPAANNTVTYAPITLSLSAVLYWTLLIVPLDNDITSYRTRALAQLRSLPDEAFLRDYLKGIRPALLTIDEDEFDECKEHEAQCLSPEPAPPMAQSRPSAFFSRK